MNICICAYACEPNKGSEPEVGWQMVNEIAKVLPNDSIYVITKYNNQESIEHENYPSNIEFIYYEPPKWLTFWKKGGKGVRTYYYIWMIAAALFMKKKNIKFDIVHHVTFVNDWLPSFIHLLKTKENKFIWGPIGSHASIESKFIDGKKRKSIEKIRIFLQLFFRNIDPSFHICKMKADCIIGITESVKKNLNLRRNKYFLAESAIAMKKNIVANTEKYEKNSNNFILISVGRLIYIKNFKLTLLSFAKFLNLNPQVFNIKLQIIGEGADKESLVSFAKTLKIDSKVEFLGQMKRADVQEHFARADLFLFPTLESAGFVTLEAMSYSLPVVAMDYGGPKQFIRTNISHQLVDATYSYDEIVDGLAKKIELFYTNEKIRLKVGAKNREEILKNFTWEAKAEKMKNIYLELTNET